MAWSIMDMALAKSDVNGPKKKGPSLQLWLRKWPKLKKKFQKRLDYIKPDLSLKSFLLTIDFVIKYNLES